MTKKFRQQRAVFGGSAAVSSLQVSNAKTKKIFYNFSKKKLVSNDSELSNSAADGGFRR